MLYVERTPEGIQPVQMVSFETNLRVDINPNFQTTWKPTLDGSVYARTGSQSPNGTVDGF